MRIAMNILVGLHRYRKQKRRQNRPRRKRDGQKNHDHAFDNATRQGIDDFLSTLREIQENRKQIKWRPGGSAEQKKFAYAIRRSKFNQNEENIIVTEKLLQFPARPLGGELRKHLTAKKIYTALHRWGYLPDAAEYQQRSGTEDDIQSDLDNAHMENTHGKEKTAICRDCCRGTWRCILLGIFPDEEYDRIRRNRNDIRLI